MKYLLLAILLGGCTLQSGTYRIKTLSDNTATFYKVKGKYTIPSNGVKAGDKIAIQRVTDKRKANVFPLKSTPKS
jgi:ribosomal protein L2